AVAWRSIAATLPRAYPSGSVGAGWLTGRRESPRLRSEPRQAGGEGAGGPTGVDGVVGTAAPPGRVRQEPHDHLGHVVHVDVPGPPLLVVGHDRRPVDVALQVEAAEERREHLGVAHAR